MAMDDETIEKMRASLAGAKGKLQFIDDPEWTVERGLALVALVQRVRMKLAGDETPPEPTSEQCSENARLADFEGRPAYAAWYPQMGGYVARAVVVIHSMDEETNDGCFEAFVWHDGTFPFPGEGPGGQIPARLHHCMPSQFASFGKLVQEIQKKVLAAEAGESHSGRPA